MSPLASSTTLPKNPQWVGHGGYPFCIPPTPQGEAVSRVMPEPVSPFARQEVVDSQEGVSQLMALSTQTVDRGVSRETEAHKLRNVGSALACGAA
jgi:hypothetical protein